MFRAATGARIEEWIFVCEIVEAALGDDLENRKRDVTENSDGQLAPRYEFLDEKFLIVLRAVLQSGCDLAIRFCNVNADGRALARRLDDDWSWNRWLLARPNHLPIRCCNSSFAELFLRADLVEGEPASFHVFTGVGNAASFEDLLDLAVLAESSVEADKGELDVVRQFEMLVTHIDFRDVCA